MQAGAGRGGALPWGRAGARPRPTQGAPPGAFAGGAGASLPSAAPPAPWLLAKDCNQGAGGRPLPGVSCLGRRGQRGRFRCRCPAHRGGPSAAPDVPSPLPIRQLQPRGPSHPLCVLGRDLAAQQRPLALSPRHLDLGEGWSRHVLCS
ncbi:hypothetical protein HJG60_008167 [Phyllostomus discolor]|uniref:Uncharacterized protein n=1 Tax=Phyllostomus discolor TaxID=89673 RepID=A0A834DP76_9CHIR|nr:hypothetical protein HJG60_008167 [Phyllostomus discolor]